MRTIVILVLVAALATAAGATARPGAAKVSGSNGRIAFAHFDRATGGELVYTANPDGSHARLLYSGPGEGPHWSPDGTRVSVNRACVDGQENCAATIVEVGSGDFRQFKWPDLTLETNCGVWTADGRRLACESFGIDDSSRNGVYTIRASDGRGLTRITSIPGGDDNPGDFSPDGRRLVFTRSVDDETVGLFVIRVDGTGLHRITPPGFLKEGESGASWSPTGNRILFANRTSADNRLAVWVVRADGSDLHKLPIDPACGGLFTDPTSISCFQPSWAPDGAKIIFTRISANGTQENVYTVNTDGSGLQRVTNTGADQADWGSHPLLP
jgi:Tol biopolymer transport system component